MLAGKGEFMLKSQTEQHKKDFKEKFSKRKILTLKHVLVSTLYLASYMSLVFSKQKISYGNLANGNPQG